MSRSLRSWTSFPLELARKWIAPSSTSFAHKRPVPFRVRSATCHDIPRRKLAACVLRYSWTRAEPGPLRFLPRIRAPPQSRPDQEHLLGIAQQHRADSHAQPSIPYVSGPPAKTHVSAEFSTRLPPTPPPSAIETASQTRADRVCFLSAWILPSSELPKESASYL